MIVCILYTQAATLLALQFAICFEKQRDAIRRLKGHSNRRHLDRRLRKKFAVAPKLFCWRITHRWRFSSCRTITRGTCCTCVVIAETNKLGLMKCSRLSLRILLLCQSRGRRWCEKANLLQMVYVRGKPFLCTLLLKRISSSTVDATFPTNIGSRSSLYSYYTSQMQSLSKYLKSATKRPVKCSARPEGEGEGKEIFLF